MRRKMTRKRRLPKATLESARKGAGVRSESLVEFFRRSPLVGTNIGLERQKDEGRGDLALIVRSAARG